MHRPDRALRSRAARADRRPGGALARRSSPPTTPNYVGGDIITGANTPIQVLFRPRFALDPYSAGTPGLYICSAATPPGAGVHGMSGYNAAQSALRQLRAS